MQAGQASLAQTMAQLKNNGPTRICVLLRGVPSIAALTGRRVMKRSSIPRVLLLTNPYISAHRLREGLRRAGSTVRVEQIASIDDIARDIEQSACIILGGVKNLPERALAELLQGAEENAVPVIVLPGDEAEEKTMRPLRSGIATYMRAQNFDRLPSVVDRVLRDSQNSATETDMRLQLERASEVLRESQKLATIGRLAASIAHEINNPLESITNLLFLISAEEGLPESVSGYLALAQRELERVAQISRQTLNFYRETNAPVRVRLADLVEEVLVLYSQKIAAKSLHVVREFGLETQVTVFPGEMRQVLSNLIANAIEASAPDGTLHLRIRNSRKWSDSRVTGLRVTIADTGSGIDPAVRHRLGQPFFTTKGQRGTGLGLWVTQSIIERYGGNLTLRSSTASSTHGTVFAIFLPTNLRPQVVAPVRDDQEPNGVKQGTGIREQGSASRKAGNGN